MSAGAARVVIASLGLLSTAASHGAEKLAPIDAEFLEYLAELEGSDEDWTLFEQARQQPRTPAKKQPKSEDAGSKKTARQTAPRK